MTDRTATCPECGWHDKVPDGTCAFCDGEYIEDGGETFVQSVWATVALVITCIVVAGVFAALGGGHG